MIATVCYIALIVAFFVAFGRGSVPRDQRRPWSLTEVVAAFGRGAWRLVDLHERNPMTPQKHRLYEGTTRPTHDLVGAAEVMDQAARPARHGAA